MVQRVLGAEAYGQLRHGAREYMNLRVQRFVEMRADLEGVFGRGESEIRINLEGCNDCCIVTRRSDGGLLFVKSCKYREEAVMNCFVGSILRGAGVLAANAYLLKTRTYLVSEDAAGAWPRGRFLEGLDYAFGEVAEERGSEGPEDPARRKRIRKNTKGLAEAGAMNYYAKEDLVLLGMMAVVFRLADCHGHNLGVAVEGARADDAR